MAKKFFYVCAGLFLLALTDHLGARSATARAGVPDVPPRYSLAVDLFPNDRRLEVSGTVRLAAADTARPDVVLSLSERMGEVRVEIVEPSSIAGVANLERMEGGGTNVKWIVRPPKPFPPRAPILLRFSYSGGGEIATMYYVGPDIAFASAWGTNWYPLVNGAFDEGVGTLTVSAPLGWSVATGGVRRGTAREEARGTFRSSVLHPTYFSFAAGRYTVVRHAGAVPLSAYLLTKRDHIGPYLEGVGGILHTLTGEFGSFPFSALSLVEVPRDLATRAGFNAVGAAGMLMLNSRAFDAPDTKYLLEWLGHELSHQWFPHAVALRTPPGLYMEEALAEYGGLRVVETIAGPAAAKQFRTTGFEYDPIYSALTYFRLVGAGVDRPLDDLQPSLEDRNLAYNKGFLVFDMLSRELGRTEFQRILHDITRRYRFQHITWHEFLDAIERESGRKLDWFFDQWFRRAGAADFQLSWSQEGDTLHGVIAQAEPYYRARLNVDVRGRGGSHMMRIFETTGPRIEFALPVVFPVQSVILDPDYEVLRWTPEYRAAADSTPSKEGRGR